MQCGSRIALAGDLSDSCLFLVKVFSVELLPNKITEENPHVGQSSVQKDGERQINRSRRFPSAPYCNVNDDEFRFDNDNTNNANSNYGSVVFLAETLD